MHLRDRRQTFQRPGDVRTVVAEEHTLTVGRVCADAYVGHDAELGHCFLHGPDRARDDVVWLAREHRVLVLAVADAEQEKSRESRGRCGTCLTYNLGERKSSEPWSGLDLLAILDRAPDDHRENESPSEVRAGERSRPDRVLREPPSCECRLSHDRMLRTNAEQAVAKGYHFTMPRRPAILLALIGLVLGASGAAFAAAPSGSTPPQSAAAAVADE